MEKVTDINQIKMAVLVKIAEYAFNGNLEEKVDEIPFELTDPIKPNFRCCVYREREIIRQRVRLAMGRVPSGLHYEKTDNTQIVHVMQAACEGCPIDRFTVTNNCHNCLTMKCIKACKFGAISKTPYGAYIDKSKCKKCGQCLKACPYHAIVDVERPCKVACPVDAVQIDDNDLAMIDESKCINCGQCVIRCPFGAIGEESMITNVINSLISDNKPIAIVAPAIEGQYGDVPLPAIKAAIRALGFKDCVEVALGADAVAWNEANEICERASEGKKTTTSCCPAFYNMVQKHFPTLMENVSTTVSPMVATARLIKSKEPNAEIVFIGPCIAKKNEVMSRYMGEIYGALTFEELQAMFIAKDINPADYSGEDEAATKYGKGFAKSGGVTAAVLKVIEEEGLGIDIKATKCSGAAECKKALMLLKAGRLPEDVIEGMACEGGCVNGPGTVDTELMVTRKIFDKYANTANTEVVENSKKYGFDGINVHRH